MAQSSFRSDIEYLRGVAVILVLLFHLKIAAVPAGFIGVDIFFVISGYLIAATLRGTLWRDILDFYDRRIRRIVPLAFFVFGVFLLAAPFFFLPFEVAQVTKSFVGATALVPNILYWLDNSYFEKQNFRPMLHYWSLGVEYQYYLLFPVLMVISRYIKFLPLLAFAVSLALCIWLTGLSPKTAFFLLPARFFEFLIGYYVFQYGGRFKLPSFAGLAGALISLAGIVCIALQPLPADSFPGAYAFAVAALTGVFILCGGSVQISRGLIFLKPLEISGRFSYSLYLIHFPVIYVIGYKPFDYDYDLTGLQKVTALIVTYGLAVLTYKFIETPFRNRKIFSARRFYGLVAVYLVLAICVVSLFHAQKFFVNSYPSEVAKISNAMRDRGVYRCGKLSRLTSPSYQSCALNEPEKENASRALLIGNSHADAIKEALKAAAEEQEVSLFMMKQNCVLGEPECALDIVISEIEARDVDGIILHSTKDGYNPQYIAPLVVHATEAGISVHVIAPVPVYDIPVPKKLYEEYRADGTRDENFRVTKEEYKAAFKDVLDLQSTLFAPPVMFYPVEPYLCPQEKCLIGDDGALYYHDDHHLTLSGSHLLEPLAKTIFLSFSGKR